LVFDVLWITFSDWTVTSVFGLSETTAYPQTVKTTLVARPAVFIFGIVRKRSVVVRVADDGPGDE
jgi:hypothetical protein